MFEYDEIRESKPISITHFDDWVMRVYPAKKKGFISELFAVSYENPSLRFKIELFFESNTLHFQFNAEQLQLDRVNKLNEKLSWGFGYRGPLSPEPSTLLESVCTEKYFKGLLEKDSKSLREALLAFQEVVQLPKEVVESILKVTHDTFSRHFQKMQELNVELCTPEKNNYALIANQMIGAQNSYGDDPTGKPVKRWIKYLIENKRLYDAIIWCSIFPKSHGKYIEIQAKGIECLMQYKTFIESKFGGNAKMFFPIGKKQDNLSYYEAIYLFASRIGSIKPDPFGRNYGRSSKSLGKTEKKIEPQDYKRFAALVLNDMTNRPSLTPFHADDAGPAEIVIELARKIRDLESENQLLKSQLQCQRSQSSTLMHFFQPISGDEQGTLNNKEMESKLNQGMSNE